VSPLTAVDTRRRALATLATVTGLLLLALAPAAQAGQHRATTTINVNPTTGQDTNPGTATLPLKTLTKALTLARSGTTIQLAAGNYGPGSSGDQFPASGLPVPAGVTITGATSNGQPASTLQGPGGGAALNLASDATISNLSLNGFGVSVFATQGRQTLSNLSITMTGGTAPLLGTRLAGGIFLFGTGQTTLNNSTILLLGAGTVGVSASAQSQVTINGGTITSGNQPTCVPTTGVQLEQAAQATLSNMHSPGFLNLTTALLVDGTSRANVSASVIQRTLPTGCNTIAASVDVESSASLTTNGLDDVENGGGNPFPPAGVDASPGRNTTAPAINISSAGPVTIQGGDIGGSVTAIRADGGSGSLTIDRALISPCFNCVDALSSAETLTISNSQIRAIDELGGFGIITSSDKPLTLRNSNLSGSARGVLVDSPFADLGTGDPGQSGNNNLASFETGVQVDQNNPIAFVEAIGDTWNPNVQGADATGHYSLPNVLFNGLSPNANGQNFELATFGDPSRVEIETGVIFGHAHLAPRRLRLSAGHSARLKVSWTHPRSWRKMRSIQLRLYRGARVVDQLTINPRHAHLNRTGALRLLGVTHDAKTVTGTITVRLGRSLAGQTLRVAVQATDIHGQRQLEPLAGTVFVTR
jgi:hypothetical protein